LKKKLNLYLEEKREMYKGDTIIPSAGMYKGQKVSLIRKGFSGWLGSTDKESCVVIWFHEMPSRKERIKFRRRKKR
jgi:hypothetical protein